MMERMIRFSWAVASLFLLFQHEASSFSLNVAPTTKYSTTRVTSTPRSSSSSRLVAIDTQNFEEAYAATFIPSTIDTIKDNSLIRRISKFVSGNKKKFAKAGVSFALTYNVISNINGSISLSTAWYIASRQTGLSPLAPGQWKTLLGAYGGLYLFQTLARPMRIALAVALTKRTESFLDYVQARLGCERPAAVTLSFTLGQLVWAGCFAAGVSTASALSGVPIFM